MKEIIINKPKGETIDFENVNQCGPIFAKLKGDLAGMIVKEERGWILRLGMSKSTSGYHSSLLECIESCIPYGYVFFTR
jgi:hypothetical protein